MFTDVDAERYEAIRRRDPSADGQFFYSVVTTGVYCRPSCAARLARPENVGFHRTPDDAERAGYRPCKRCKPREASQEERHAMLVERACRWIEASEGVPTLESLAAAMDLSPHYLHRLFKARTGMTPREYFAAHRLKRVDRGLREGANVTAAFHDAGYGSSSRFYEEASGALGMAPSTLRKGGEGITIRAVVTRCTLGRVLVAVTESGVCATAFGDSDASLVEELHRRFPKATIERVKLANDDDLAALVREVVAMVESPEAKSNVPIDLIGTAFQQKVWRALREIPAGTTVSYSELARRIGAPKAVRAVGTACGNNPVAVVVPCHRVVREDGELGGYRWGLSRKKTLLARERRH